MPKKIHDFGRNVKRGLQSVLSSSPDKRRHARRFLAIRALGLFRNELTFERNGFLWTGATASSITEAIYISDHYQDAHISELVGWLKLNTGFERSFIVNVGANIGDVALPLTRTGKQVVAIEPNPETFGRLQRNVRQNQLESKITCCAVAISGCAGRAELVIATDPGNSEIREPNGKLGFDGVDQQCGRVEVTTSRLDQLLRSIQVPIKEVALVWSDTQGFESQVVESGIELWQNHTPLWVEIWPKGLACHGGVERFLGLAERHFSRMLLLEGLRGAPAPIAQLRPVVGKLKDAEFIDALLLP